nr:hypothetical protein [Tanacetum cinerariifolium]
MLLGLCGVSGGSSRDGENGGKWKEKGSLQSWLRHASRFCDLAMVVSLEHLMLLTRLTLFDAAEPFVVAVHDVWHWWSVGDVGLDRLKSSVSWRGRLLHLQPRQMHHVCRLLAYLRCQNALTEAEIVCELACQIVTFAATTDASCLSIASLLEMSECTNGTMADASCLSIASLPEMLEFANGGKDYHKRADCSCPYVSLDDVVVHNHRSLCYQEREWATRKLLSYEVHPEANSRKHTAICTTGYAHHSVNNKPAVFAVWDLAPFH